MQNYFPMVNDEREITALKIFYATALPIGLFGLIS